MGIPGAAVARCLVYHNSGAGRSEGCAVEVKYTVQLGFRQKYWIEARRTEEVECEGSMGDEAVPEMQGEVGVAATEAGNEVILVGLDCKLCGVGVMKVWGNKLEPYAEISQKRFEAAGAFIVEHLVLGVRPRSES